MFTEVVKAEYVDGYRIRLWFNNKVEKVVDLRHSLQGKVFEPLKDLDFFKRFTVKFNPNRSLETKSILFYCHAAWSPHLSKAWRATSRQSGGQDAGKRTKAVGKQCKTLNISPMRSNDRFGFNTIEWENGADFAPEYLLSLPDA